MIRYACVVNFLLQNSHRFCLLDKVAGVVACAGAGMRVSVVVTDVLDGDVVVVCSYKKIPGKV